MNKPHTYLDPKLLSKFKDLRVLTTSVVEGVISGIHRSPFMGSSVEFAEFKEYTPGDDIRHIDWRAYGKSDKYYVKQFEDETNLLATLLLDESGSMGFGSGPLTKIQYATYLASCLSYLFIRQGDSAGLMLYGEEPGAYLPPRAHTNQLDDLFSILDSVRLKGGTSLRNAFRHIAERIKQRSLLFVISDLLDLDEETMALARVLKTRSRLNITFFHILDREELTFPYEGLSQFKGLESEGKLLVDPEDIRNGYLKEFNSYLKFVKGETQKSQLSYFRAVTDQPLEQVLFRFLKGIGRKNS